MRFIAATKYIKQDGEEPTYIRPDAIVALRRSEEPGWWQAFVVISLQSPTEKFYVPAAVAFDILGKEQNPKQTTRGDSYGGLDD